MAVVVVLQPADLRRRRNAEDHLIGDAVVVDVLDVAAHTLQHAEPLELLQDLAADLERVAALRRIEEIGGRPGPLLAIAIVLVLLCEPRISSRPLSRKKYGSVPLVICGK